MFRLILTMVFVLSVGLSSLSAQESLMLKAADGLPVTADVYKSVAKSDASWIVLAHQAGSSRGEYRKIAPRLNKLGFNAIAIDQRSGKTFAGVRNETAQRASTRGKARGYKAAIPDIEAAVAWARGQTTGPVVLWGSSYSAALAILLTGEQPAIADAVVAMSPGEYIRGRGIAKAAVRIKVPVLITSPASERGRWRRIFAAIPGTSKVGFAPSTGGRHGSSALIASRNKSANAYWAVTEKFLARYVSKP